MARTKILCTLGPASENEAAIEEMVKAGMSAVRLNFSHGTKAQHLARMRSVRAVSKRTGCRLAVLMDLQGPKIRLGAFSGGAAHLEKGAPFTLTTLPVVGDATRASTTYKALPHDVRRGSRIFLADGSLELSVQRVKGTEVLTEVVRGGVVRNSQGINLPGTPLRTPSLTIKDRADLDFGLRHGVDLVALSFVRHSKDVEALRGIVNRRPKPPWIVAKIEKQEALDEIEAILDAADGVMVARGDLGVEVGLERVPEIQKRVIAEANRRGRFSITATQMLESMIDHPRPTRAEVSDVANAVFDGTDALMLSAESAVGAFPARAVEIMGSIAEEAENSAFYGKTFDGFARIGGFHRAASYAAASAARELGAAALISITPTGRMPRLLARFRLPLPIIACSASDAVLDRLALIWGVVPLKIAASRHAERAIESALNAARASGLVQRGQDVVVTLSMLSGGSEATNVVKLHRV
jgi:pyruvate kinase